MDSTTQKTANAAGGLTGCVISILLFSILGVCSMPVSAIFMVFSYAGGMANPVLGPVLCPAETSAVIKNHTVYTKDSLGIYTPGSGYYMVCEDGNGREVQDIQVQANYIWGGLVFLAGFILAGILCIFLSAPFGIAVTVLFKKIFTKKRPAQ